MPVAQKPQTMPLTVALIVSAQAAAERLKLMMIVRGNTQPALWTAFLADYESRRFFFSSNLASFTTAVLILLRVSRTLVGVGYPRQISRTLLIAKRLGREEYRFRFAKGLFSNRWFYSLRVIRIFIFTRRPCRGRCVVRFDSGFCADVWLPRRCRDCSRVGLCDLAIDFAGASDRKIEQMF